MSGATIHRHAQWWADSVLTAERTRPLVVGHAARPFALAAFREVMAATLAARAWRWAARGLARLSAQREPRNRQELLAYARSIEEAMPNLAAELRFFACND